MNIKIQKDVLLKKYSTFGVGEGRAEYFFDAHSPEEIMTAVLWAKDKKIPFGIFAGGSNIIFPDKNLRGLTIRVSGGEVVRSKNVFTVYAGTPLKDVVTTSIDAGFEGLETLSGIPGTICGAVFGNAGAYGRSIADAVRDVEIFDGAKRMLLSNKMCRFGYRDSIFKKKDYVILRVMLELSKGNKKALKDKSQEIIAIREKKYPSGSRSPGSFFKNIPVSSVSKSSLKKLDHSKIIFGKIPAGYLLEAVNAKNVRVDGISVAPYHGNLILNNGRGTEKDVKKLSGLLIARVKRKFGITLEPEVQYFENRYGKR